VQSCSVLFCNSVSFNFYVIFIFCIKVNEDREVKERGRITVVV